jgi:16S rRNA (uracil1498-N3)-methyltransferase
MHYFYIPQKISSGFVLISDAEQLHHLKDVLRLKIDDQVMVFDGEGTRYVCRIAGLDRKQANLFIISKKDIETPGSKITIACAIPKKAKMDEIIDKLTQLGVDTIIPMLTERVLIKPDEKKENRYERWGKIALSASEQSQRSILPVITKVTSLKELLAGSDQYSLKLIPTLEGERINIRLVKSADSTANILVLIGPEGDFSPQEVNQARDCGFIPVSLGQNILRVDTAAIAAASYLRFATSDYPL